jgi:opacity protein-like surface antigen
VCARHIGVPRDIAPKGFVPMRLIMRTAVLALGVMLCLAGDARADGYISPFIGVNFGGDAGGTFKQNADDRNRVTYGFQLGGMKAGVFGAEVDLAYTPNFFGSTGVDKNSVLLVMPTAIIGIPIGGQRGAGIRPYATAGFGLMRRRLEVGGVEVLDDNDAAYSVGGGVMGFFATHIGLRADYRYFRNFDSDLIDFGNLEVHRGTFDFSRATAGLVFRF